MPSFKIRVPTSTEHEGLPLENLPFCGADGVQYGEKVPRQGKNNTYTVHVMTYPVRHHSCIQHTDNRTLGFLPVRSMRVVEQE